MSDLRFEDVSVRFGRGRKALTAVVSVDLEVPAGSVVGLVGESGSGKSTLGRSAVGLVDPSAGRVTIGGRPLADWVRSGIRPVQMVFQDPQGSLDPRMTIASSIGEVMPKRAGTGRSGRSDEVARLLDLVGLGAEFGTRHPRELSGGQRQRVAIARALAAQPQVIIADEVTSALDVSVQGTILNMLRETQRTLGFSMLFISHNLAVVRYVSDYVAVIYLGQIVESGPASEVFEQPSHPYTRQLLESAPREHSTSPVAVSDVGLAADPPDPHSPPSGCRFHTRCPIGPLLDPERHICRTVDPQSVVATRRNHAACHFADEETRAE